MTFYERVADLITQKGISQKQFLIDLDFNKNQMVKWKNGTTPTRHSLNAVSNYFNVSVEYLLGSTDEKTPLFPSADIVVYDELGTVRAGFDGLIDGTPTGRRIEIPTSSLKGRNKDDFFTLRVSGDSMYPRLLDGDTVLVLRCDSVDSGDIAIVMYGNEDATIKKVNYVQGEDWLDLEPFNPEYKTKRIEGADLQYCHVLGKVVKLIRDM